MMKYNYYAKTAKIIQNYSTIHIMIKSFARPVEHSYMKQGIYIHNVSLKKLHLHVRENKHI